jgi:hypothetical protein
VIAGQRVAVTPEQLAQLGDATSGLKGALDQLAAQGVHLSYLKPADSQDGVTSAALQVSWTAPVPNYGTATITVLLGRTFVHVSNQPLEGSAVPSLGDAVPPASSASDASPTGSSAGPPFPPGDFPPGGATGTGSSSVSVPIAVAAGLASAAGVSGPAPEPSTAGGAPLATAPATRLVAAPAALADRTPVSRLGPVLALSALALLATVGLYRRYGVISR